MVIDPLKIYINYISLHRLRFPYLLLLVATTEREVENKN